MQKSVVLGKELFLSIHPPAVWIFSYNCTRAREMIVDYNGHSYIFASLYSFMQFMLEKSQVMQKEYNLSLYKIKSSESFAQSFFFDGRVMAIYMQ